MFFRRMARFYCLKTALIKKKIAFDGHLIELRCRQYVGYQLISSVKLLTLKELQTIKISLNWKFCEQGPCLSNSLFVLSTQLSAGVISVWVCLFNGHWGRIALDFTYPIWRNMIKGKFCQEQVSPALKNLSGSSSSTGRIKTITEKDKKKDIVMPAFWLWT